MKLIAIALAIACLIFAACGGDDDSSNGATATPAASGSGLPQGNEPVDLDSADFTVDIDNEFWPMEPGAQWTYTEIDEDGNELQVVVTVTTATRQIANGITARVVRDTVTQDGEVIEDTFDWYAQDSQGNIWYLGEDTAEFEDGEIVSTEGAWEAGVDGALPGIVIPANPVVGMKYRQEYYEGEAEDNGEILSIGEQAEVPFGQFEGVLRTKDTTALDPDVIENKLYAPGVGPILAMDPSGTGGSEELTNFENVGDEIAAAAGTTPLGEPYQ